MTIPECGLLCSFILTVWLVFSFILSFASWFQGGISLKMEAINSEYLLGFLNAVPPDLILQLSFCLEAVFVMDCHPNGEIK